MNGHFYVVNKKALILCFIVMVINGCISGISFGKLLGGASNLWLIPVIVFVTFFIISALVMSLVVTAGIDVKRGIVIIPDADARKGKQPKFHISEVEKIHLENAEGTVLNVDTDSLFGGRIVFHLKDGRKEQYYPISITKKQYKSIESGIMSMIDELNNEKLFND